MRYNPGTMLAPLKLALLVISVTVLTWSQGSAPAQSSIPSPQVAQSTVTSTPPKTLSTYVLDPIETTNAIYPLAAREQQIQGKVETSILVSETGSVEHTTVFRCNELLAAAVEDATSKWKFKPVVKDGHPVAVTSKVTFNFVLSDDNQSLTGVAPDIAPATEFPQRVRVSQGVSTGLILQKITPTYPEDAKAARIHGAVFLQVEISKEGAISDIKLISGHPALVPAAIEAVRQWRYKPYLLNGRPIAVETQVQVNFALSLR